MKKYLKEEKVFHRKITPLLSFIVGGLFFLSIFTFLYVILTFDEAVGLWRGIWVAGYVIALLSFFLSLEALANIGKNIIIRKINKRIEKE